MVDSSSSGAHATSLGSYLPALDGLRAIAVSLVIWYHAPYVFLRTPGGQEGHWAHAHGGWMGVDLFFVISGYLITSILLRSRANPRQLSMFWARRALRILPLAFLYLAILMLLAPRDPLHIGFGDFDDWWLYFAYLGNLHIVADGWQPPVLMILWSLAVEEQFYLLWPLAVRFTRPQALLRLCLSLVVIAPLVRVVVDDTLGYPAA